MKKTHPNSFFKVIPLEGDLLAYDYYFDLGGKKGNNYSFVIIQSEIAPNGKAMLCEIVERSLY